MSGSGLSAVSTRSRGSSLARPLSRLTSRNTSPTGWLRADSALRQRRRAATAAAEPPLAARRLREAGLRLARMLDEALAG